MVTSVLQKLFPWSSTYRGSGMDATSSIYFCNFKFWLSMYLLHPPPFGSFFSCFVCCSWVSLVFWWLMLPLFLFSGTIHEQVTSSWANDDASPNNRMPINLPSSHFKVKNWKERKGKLGTVGIFVMLEPQPVFLCRAFFGNRTYFHWRKTFDGRARTTDPNGNNCPGHWPESKLQDRSKPMWTTGLLKWTNMDVIDYLL